MIDVIGLSGIVTFGEEEFLMMLLGIFGPCVAFRIARNFGEYLIFCAYVLILTIRIFRCRVSIDKRLDKIICPLKIYAYIGLDSCFIKQNCQNGFFDNFVSKG